MEKGWEDMTVDEKLDALRSENADQIKTDLRLSSGIDDLALQTTAFFAIVGAMSENGLPQVDRVEAWCERLRLVNGVGGDVPASQNRFTRIRLITQLLASLLKD